MQPNQPQDDKEGFYRRSVPQSSYFESEDQPLPQPATSSADDNAVVAWDASEYIHRSKDALWTTAFLAFFVLLFGVSIWLQAWTFAALVVAMAVAMGYFAFRRPKTKHYVLSSQGLQIDEKMYRLSNYRAFGILPEDAFFSAMLIPTGRFKPVVTAYFSKEDGEKIVDILGAHLPMLELKPDFVDVIMRRLHF